MAESAPPTLVDLLKGDTEVFVSLVEVSVLDPSPKNRAIFQNHLHALYPCVEQLMTRKQVVYAAVREGSALHAIAVMRVPDTYLGSTPTPVDHDFTAQLM